MDELSANPLVPARSVMSWVITLAVLTLGVYAVSLKSGFVYDAAFQIQDDDYIHTPSHLVDVLTFRVMSQDVLDFNRPVHLLVLMVDSLIWGRNPVGYHLTSILFHTASTVLLFLILDQWLTDDGAADDRHRANRFAAALAAVVFAVHPVCVEAVAEPSYREDVLVGFFLLMAVWLAGRWCGSCKGRAALPAVGMLVCVLAAVGSKETGVAVVPVLAAYWWLRRWDRPRKPWIVLLAAATAVTAAFVVARFALEPTTSQVFVEKATYVRGSFAAAMQLQPTILAMYLLHFVRPTQLCADYTAYSLAGISPALGYATLATLLLVQAVAAWGNRLMLMAAVIFWATLLPASNLLPMYRPVADRYCYVPMVGVAIAAAAVLSSVTRRGGLQIARLAVAGVVVVLLAVLCVERQRVFANPMTFWTSTVATNPTSVTATGSLAWAKMDAGDMAGSLNGFAREIEMSRGQNADAFAGAAMVMEKIGRHPEAEQLLSRAIGVSALFADPQRNRKSLILTPAQADTLGTIARRLPATRPAGS